MTSWGLLVVFCASIDGGVEWYSRDDLVAAARSGDPSARNRIKQLLQRTDSGTFVPSVTLPSLLSTPDDMWAEPLLRHVALTEETGLGSLALVSWWRLHRERDDGLLRQILEEGRDRSRIKDTALELLLRSGDPWGLAVQRKLWREACAEVANGSGVGLVWKRPSVVDAALVGPDLYYQSETLIAEHVCPESRAETAGFGAGDRILKVGDTICESYRQCIGLVDLARDSLTQIVVAPADKKKHHTVRRFPPKK